MLKRLVLALFFMTLCAGGAKASTAEVREVARLNNCTPKKIEVIRSDLGSSSRTLYRVECNMPKISDESRGPRAESIVVRCDGSLCGLVRAVPSNEK